MFVFIAQWDNFSDFLPWIMLNKTVICSRKNWSIRFLNVYLFVLETRLIITGNIFNISNLYCFFHIIFSSVHNSEWHQVKIASNLCVVRSNYIFEVSFKNLLSVSKRNHMAMNKKEINLLFAKNVWFKPCKLSLFAFNESMKINLQMQSKSWIEKKCEFHHRHITFTDYVQYISWIIKNVRFWL